MISLRRRLGWNFLLNESFSLKCVVFIKKRLNTRYSKKALKASSLKSAAEITDSNRAICCD